jgi:uncharacterized protein (TIGR03435 family)
MLLMRAYGVQSYQVEGPGTIDSERYDAFAKVPDGEPPQRIPEMLQNMLVERFQAGFFNHKDPHARALLPILACTV